MYRYFFNITIFMLLFTISCDDDTLCCGPAGECTEIMCDAPMVWIGIQYQDAETGEDLIFGEEASYTLDNLSVESLTNDLSYSLSVDSTTTDFHYTTFFLSASDTLKFTLGELAPDTVAASTLFLDIGCCGELELTELYLNSSTVCTACDNNQIVTIEK